MRDGLQRRRARTSESSINAGLPLILLVLVPWIIRYESVIGTLAGCEGQKYSMVLVKGFDNHPPHEQKYSTFYRPSAIYDNSLFIRRRRWGASKSGSLLGCTDDTEVRAKAAGDDKVSVLAQPRVHAMGHWR